MAKESKVGRALGFGWRRTSDASVIAWMFPTIWTKAMTAAGFLVGGALAAAQHAPVWEWPFIALGVGLGVSFLLMILRGLWSVLDRGTEGSGSGPFDNRGTIVTGDHNTITQNISQGNHTTAPSASQPGAAIAMLGGELDIEITGGRFSGHPHVLESHGKTKAKFTDVVSDVHGPNSSYIEKMFMRYLGPEREVWEEKVRFTPGEVVPTGDGNFRTSQSIEIIAPFAPQAVRIEMQAKTLLSARFVGLASVGGPAVDGNVVLIIGHPIGTNTLEAIIGEQDEKIATSFYWAR